MTRHPSTEDPMGPSIKVQPGDFLNRQSTERRAFDGNISIPQGFLPSCLLLLLAERSGHGYELGARLHDFGFCIKDFSGVYAALRRLQKDDLLQAELDAPVSGPARRMYSVTPAGRATLRQCCESLATMQAQMRTFVDRCNELQHR